MNSSHTFLKKIKVSFLPFCAGMGSHLMGSHLRELLSTLSFSTCGAFLFPEMVGYGPTLKGWALIVWKVFACRGCSHRIKNTKIFSYLGTLILTQCSRITWSPKNNYIKDQTIFRKSSHIIGQKELSCFFF